MANIPLGGWRGEGRFIQVSDHRLGALPTLEWRIKKFQHGYEQVIRAGSEGWRFPLARIIMAQIVNRSLLKTEHVHHRDEDPLNNTDENLLLMTKGQHIAEHNRRNRSYERAEQSATEKRRSDPGCGAYHNHKNRWSAYFLGKYLGMFPTQEEAAACYRKALEEGIDAARVVRRDPNNENRGLYLQPSGRWQARFRARSLGTYDTKDEAIAAYRKAVADHEANREPG